MLFEIKHRITAKLLFSLECGSLKITLEAAVKTKTDLSDADLSGADLSDANLSDAYLSDADLEPIKADLFTVLNAAPNEVAGLRQALIDGKVDGSCYTGKCACLLGTIANIRHCEVEGLGIEPDSSRPIERFFLSIRPGKTPENSRKVKDIVGWIDQWIAEKTAASMIVNCD